MKKKITYFLVCLLIAGLCLSVFVGAQKNPADSISLPAALISGHTYDLQQKDLKLSVNGQSCEASFQAEGTQAVLSYADGEGNEVASYTLPVVDTNNAADHCAYFYDKTGAITKTENENDIALSFSKDSEIAFISKLNAQDVAMYVSFAEDKTNFTKLHLTLTDAADATVKLTFTVDLQEQTVSQGKTTEELDKLGQSLQLRYKNSARKIMLGTDKTLFLCEKDDSGEAFSGFSGGVYLTVSFEGVTAPSTLHMTRVGNQPLGHKDSTTADMTEPTISFTTAVASSMKMGDTFQIPTYEAYDAYSPIAESSLTVEAPDGTAYTESFTISQYGQYKMTVKVKDAAGNQMKTVKMIFVSDDVLPQLTVSAMETTSYKVGDKVTIPTYTASDNLDKYFVDVILFMPNGEIRLLTHDATGEITYSLTDTGLYAASFISDNTSFKAEQTGKHIIRYVAYDDQYNRVVQELTFTVE